MMRGMKREDHCSGESSQKSSSHNLQQLYYQDHHHQLLLYQHQHETDIFSGVRSGDGGGLIYQEVSPMLQNPIQEPHNIIDPSLGLPSPPVPYSGLFNHWAASSQQFPHGGDHLRLISDTARLGELSEQEIIDAKALAASKAHSEAERRRRERINNHLSKLRSMLPSTIKTDKASLLAEVIQHVKELKRRTSLIAEANLIPTEMDELMVDDASDEVHGKFVVRASMCCEDRPDLLIELSKTLKAMRLRTLKAEIMTLGGRVKNILFIAGEEGHSSATSSGGDHYQQCTTGQYSVSCIQEALRAVMEKAGGNRDDSSWGVKRQRTAKKVDIVQHMSLP
ncbi:hypothetical protein SAY87_025087 [Trapa incisa]|uniref:BHLH domain-containing protein n=1 Tax=Trapa incisa TaxID=236973 RepID=A0AAN7GGW3_9MYRT|nr:hypothetical protein SAY87_025087 [Trapa incisa]